MNATVLAAIVSFLQRLLATHQLPASRIYMVHDPPMRCVANAIGASALIASKLWRLATDDADGLDSPDLGDLIVYATSRNISDIQSTISHVLHKQSLQIKVFGARRLVVIARESSLIAGGVLANWGRCRGIDVIGLALIVSDTGMLRINDWTDEHNSVVGVERFFSQTSLTGLLLAGTAARFPYYIEYLWYRLSDVRLPDTFVVRAGGEQFVVCGWLLSLLQIVSEQLHSSLFITYYLPRLNPSGLRKTAVEVDYNVTLKMTSDTRLFHRLSHDKQIE